MPALRELDDPLGAALRHKAATDAPGAAETRSVAAGDGWRVVDVLCTAGPRDRPFEERQPWATISLVLAGTFSCRSDAGAALLSAGSWLVLGAGQTFECSHRHGEGDHCLSFQFEPGWFERLAGAAGRGRARFTPHRVPPLRELAPLTARAAAAAVQPEAMDELAVELAGSLVALGGDARPLPPAAHRIAPILRRLDAAPDASHTLTDLARDAGLSPYHFLRTFKGVTGLSPHQWLLRTRLRRAARLLLTTRRPVTDVALDVGFQDLSNFIRSFRAEFGASPRRYRGAGVRPIVA